jgi:outer membrane protein assembly factor BamB
MKIKQLLIVLFLLLPLFTFAQFEKGSPGVLSLTIKQSNTAPAAYAEIWLTEKSTSEKSTNYTDKNGNVQFPVLEGYTYIVNFKNDKNNSEIPVHFDRNGLMTKRINYNPPRNRSVSDRNITWQKETINDKDITKKETQFSINLLNNNNIAAAGKKIYLAQTGTKNIFAALTNPRGIALFKLPLYSEFILSIEKQENICLVNTQNLDYANLNKSFRYEPGKPVDVNTDAYTIVADTVHKKITIEEQPGFGEALIKINAQNSESQPVTGAGVRLLCMQIKKIFTAVTDKNGIAKFIVPADKTYLVGLEENNSLGQVIVPRASHVYMTVPILFEPTHIHETMVNDTITQKLPRNVHATTSRSYYEVKVRNYADSLLGGEMVYFKERGTALVYAAVADEWGIARVLLPKGKLYTINLKYEYNIGFVDIAKDNKFHHVQLDNYYRGTLAIINYYNRPRDANGFYNTFWKSATASIDVKDRQFAEKTTQGYKLNFNAPMPVSTPSLAADQLITSSGYYSNNLYGFDQLTGKTNWGIQLAEGGASNSVCEDSVVIVNTESCTLYAIDSKTGKMLWSKWLSAYLYTTPSIYQGKIYTVYANDLNYYGNESTQNIKHPFVLACFDLHKGDIVWQSWLDDNVLGAPVIDHGRVYITSLRGKLSLFNAQDGKLLKDNQVFATTNPLVLDKRLFITTRNANGIETASIYNADNLTLIKNCTAMSVKKPDTGNPGNSTLTDMNYSGTRMISYKNKNYNVMGNRLFCSSPVDGKIIWYDALTVKRKDSTQPFATMPVVAGGKIIIGTTDGKIKIYDPETGRLLNEYATEGNIWTQPMVHNGWIYAGTQEGKMVSIDTHDPALTGWDMWNYKPDHNTAVQTDSNAK